MNKVAAIIQARLGSTRLPGKVLMSVCGKPLLWHLVKRLERSEKIDEIIVATTDAKGDDPIDQLCRQEGFSCFRGSEPDVLDRFCQAGRGLAAEYIVRITADCPLMDPAVVDEVIELCMRDGADYATNTNPPTYPDGLDVEVFTFAALERSWREAKHKYQREHVTSFITEHPQEFRLANHVYHRDLSAWRLTIDEPEDLEVVKGIYECLYQAGAVFSFEEIVSFLDKNKALLSLNKRFVRNENYDTNNK